MTRRGVAALGAVVWFAVPASAEVGEQGDEYLARLATTVRARLDAVVASHAPKLVPPTPIKPTWRVHKVGTIELGAPLVALTAAELDGDPRAGELYAVTPHQVVAIGFRNGKLLELGRVAFAGERAVPAPRDVVGTAVVEGNEVVAAASSWAKELRVRWTNKKLVAKPGNAGFLVCPGERAQLAPGRNHFGTTSNATYGVRCRDDLVDPTGYPLRVRAELAPNGKLAVTVDRCEAGGGSCQRSGSFELSKVGVAFAIADVDRDGLPEVIVSDASAPGAPDSVKVLTLGGNDKGLFRRPFNGGVAGLVAIDGDDADDVAEVLAAVRFPGATRVDVWRLD